MPLASLLRASLCALGLMAGGAAPAQSDCRLALALAVDISRSIDSQDYIIQTEGLALALEDPEIRRAIFAPEGEVVLAIYYWSGRGYQDLVQPWVRLDGPEALDNVITGAEAAVKRMKTPYAHKLLSTNVAFLRFFWTTIQSNAASPAQMKAGFQMFLDAQQAKAHPQVSDRDSFRGGRKQDFAKKEKSL